MASGWVNGSHKKGQMQVGTLRVRLNKVGSDVPVTSATPAEALVLHILHQQNNGGSTYGDKMENIDVAKTEIQRTDAEELNRLQSKYGRLKTKEGKSILSMLWPDRLNPKLPQKFSDLKWADIHFDGVEVAAVNYSTGAVTDKK